jgi:ornithine carbamoyltransferase
MKATRMIGMDCVMNGARRHFLSLADLGPETISILVEKSLSISRDDKIKSRALKDKTVGIYFKVTSTRTRTAFTVGALRLGANAISFGPNDLQINTGESVSDTGRVLSGFLDLLVVRTNGAIEEMEQLAYQSDMAVINAMSENEHPTQAIADLVTLREALGRLKDVQVLYIGEGNNSAAALALAVAQTPGMALTIVTPERYGLERGIFDRACKLAGLYGASIEQTHDLDRLPRNVDAVYTTRWETMGAPKPDFNWRAKFEPYRVTPEFMAKVSKPSGTIFMHDLPAIRGDEAMNEVLDGPQSVAFRQARHKLTSAMSILTWCAGVS